VVAGVDGGLMLVELLASDDLDRREADEEEGACPQVSDGVLLATGLVPKAGEEGDTAEARGSQAYEGGEKEIRQPAQGEGRLLRGDGCCLMLSVLFSDFVFLRVFLLVVCL
jgi:hypothetical protein